MVKGKCDSCKKRATTEWLIISTLKRKIKSATTSKWCDNHSPTVENEYMYKIHENKRNDTKAN